MDSNDELQGRCCIRKDGGVKRGVKPNGVETSLSFLGSKTPNHFSIKSSKNKKHKPSNMDLDMLHLFECNMNMINIYTNTMNKTRAEQCLLGHTIRWCHR